MLTVCKEFRFDSAHYLPYYDGKCRKLHGHTFRLQVEVSSNGLIAEGPKTGMIVDFGDLKDLVELILVKMDHTFLNDLHFNPTAENLVSYLFEKLSQLIRDHALCALDNKVLTLRRLRLYESDTSWAELTI